MSERPSMNPPDDTDEPRADDPASDPGSDLEVLAITEEYVAAYRAGQHPRLSDFAARYPTHAAALADFAAQFLEDAAMGEDEPAAGDEPAGARPLSAGTRRALDALFGAPAGGRAAAYDAGGAGARLPSVAETPAPYAPSDQGDGTDERPERGDGDAPARRPTEDAGGTGRLPGSRS